MPQFSSAYYCSVTNISHVTGRGIMMRLVYLCMHVLDSTVS